MRLYRIAKSTYAQDLSGTGAGLYGGRWNPKGLNMVYSAGSIALASLEYLAHNFHLIPTLESSLSIIEIPDDAPIIELQKELLPKGWDTKLGSYHNTQNLGKEFLSEGKAYVLKVPSVIVPMEYNYLLNPLHSVHKHAKIIEMIIPFKLDSRLVGQ
ncbi:RES family NAD+ phosphorylase [Roseivirga sp.]|uniref:RES family NAD+ phosphorylase n=1 Tax=Roseivirga sp. TaxID=1964215 RepID=UPI003B52F9C3